MAHQSHHRLLIAAAVFFFIASSYLCVTRLYSAPFASEAKDDKSKSSAAHSKPVHVTLTDADLPMTYGSFRRPNMDGLTLMASLPAELVPTFENKRRLVIVGDIHGMDAMLETLLQKVDFDTKRDHLIATGDMINKGPDSPGVVSRLMRLNASAVRGNHEDRILLSLAEAEARSGVSKDLSSADAEAHRGESEFLATGRKLSKEHVQWLAKLPVILAVEPLRMFIAHAGLVPGVRPELQDPWAVMNMRTLIYPREEMRKNELKKRSDTTRDSDDASDEAPQSPAPADQPSNNNSEPEHEEEEEGETLESVREKDAYTDREVAIPVEGRDGEKWPNAWNRLQRRLKKSHRYTVVYGHDAKRGFRQTRYTFGLDSGCVKGGALTALVVEGKEGGKGGFTHTVMQVHCENAKS
ncbi:Metallo-dependent phosphatase-like protein [Trichoderma chlorosporum]